MKTKARIAVLVSGGGTNLQAILDAAGRGEIPDGEIVLVISDRPGAYALERAEKAGIPAQEISKNACGGQEAFEKQLITVLTEQRIDLIVLAGFLSILTENTVHFVNEIPDGGEIIAQKAVEILPGDTPEILQRRVMEQAEWIILPRSVEKIAGEIVSATENGRN